MEGSREAGWFALTTCRWAPGAIAPIGALVVLTLSLAANAGWPDSPSRSGSRLPEPRVLSVAARATGAYVPEVSDLSLGKSAVLVGEVLWNYAFGERFGFFGEHSLMGMWWGNSRLLAPGHEVGVRYLCADGLAFEAAYLGHRVDRAWVDGHESRPGGVMDNGAELVAALGFEPARRLRLEGRLYGRIFDVYRDTQGVTGVAVRASFLPFDRHALGIEIEVSRTIRGVPRAGVEKDTWNVIGGVTWTWGLSERFGLLIGGRLSTNLLVGEVPMLELKRSMIDEPMALGTLGVYFSI